MDFKDIVYSKEDGIATIKLNRPAVLNAFNAMMVAEWTTAIKVARDDPDVRVLVVTGNGRAFCSGLDLKAAVVQSDAPPTDPRLDIWSVSQILPRALATLDKPYIASINGPAIGGGFDACSMADFRIASDRATFAINHLKIGGLSVDGGYYFLARLLGAAKTIELVLKSEMFGADEALRIGYVNAVVPHEKLAETSLSLARRLAAGPSIPMRHAKRLIYQAAHVSLEQHLSDVLEAAQTVRASADFREGPRAILERRPAQFKGE